LSMRSGESWSYVMKAFLVNRCSFLS